VTVIAAAALITYLGGVRLAHSGHLPQWWPGTGAPPVAPAPAIGGAVGNSAAPPDPLDPESPIGETAPFWPEPTSPMLSGEGVLGGPVVAADETTPNLGRPPRLRPPPLPGPPPPLDGGPRPDSP
jgi:hypothetical protein